MDTLTITIDEPIELWAGYQARSLQNALQTPSESIRLNLHCTGGNIGVAFEMAKMLDDEGRPVDVVVADVAAGAATLLLLGRRSVHVVPNGVIALMEPCLISLTCSEADIAKTQACRDRIVAKYLEHVKVDEQTIRQAMADERWLTGPEAVEWGFATSAG